MSSSGITPYISPIICVVSWIFYVAAAATPIYYYGGWGYGPWRSCDDRGCSYNRGGSCSNAVAARDAVAAFLIINCLFMILAAIFAILRIFVAALQAGGCVKLVYVIVLVMCLVFGLIAWTVGFSLYGGTYCGIKYYDYPESRVGPSPPLALVAWIFNIVAIVTECYYNPGVKSEAESQMHQAGSQPANNTTTSSAPKH